MKEIPLVLIKWQDITSSHTGWIEAPEIEKLKTANCYSVGWIVKEDKKNYYIVSALVEHDDIWSQSFDTVIPKGVVDKITTLRKRWW